MTDFQSWTVLIVLAINLAYWVHQEHQKDKEGSA